MATLGKIKCDLCGFVGDLESVNGNATLRTPAMWASVSPTVRISGERQIDRKEREKLRDKVLKKMNTMHICPGCMVDEAKWRSAGPLKLASVEAAHV